MSLVHPNANRKVFASPVGYNYLDEQSWMTEPSVGEQLESTNDLGEDHQQPQSLQPTTQDALSVEKTTRQDQPRQPRPPPQRTSPTQRKISKQQLGKLRLPQGTAEVERFLQWVEQSPYAQKVTVRTCSQEKQHTMGSSPPSSSRGRQKQMEQDENQEVQLAGSLPPVRGASAQERATLGHQQKGSSVPRLPHVPLPPTAAPAAASARKRPVPPPPRKAPHDLPDSSTAPANTSSPTNKKSSPTKLYFDSPQYRGMIFRHGIPHVVATKPLHWTVSPRVDTNQGVGRAENEKKRRIAHEEQKLLERRNTVLALESIMNGELPKDEEAAREAIVSDEATAWTTQLANFRKLIETTRARQRQADATTVQRFSRAAYSTMRVWSVRTQREEKQRSKFHAQRVDMISLESLDRKLVGKQEDEGRTSISEARAADRTRIETNQSNRVKKERSDKAAKIQAFCRYRSAQVTVSHKAASDAKRHITHTEAAHRQQHTSDEAAERKSIKRQAEAATNLDTSRHTSASDTSRPASCQKQPATQTAPDTAPAAAEVAPAAEDKAPEEKAPEPEEPAQASSSVDNEHQAATKIQAVQRGRIARQQVEEKKREEAAADGQQILAG